MIEITEKVLKYMKTNGYIGIALKREIQSFGWAGCRDIIQGEFIKEISQIEVKKIKYEAIDISGIKVFIPEYLKDIKEIKISSLFSVFSKIMLLNIETTDVWIIYEMIRIWKLYIKFSLYIVV